MLFAILFILIVVLPIGFIKWISRKNYFDKYGLDSRDYWIMSAALSDKINILDCCVIVGCMEELN